MNALFPHQRPTADINDSHSRCFGLLCTDETGGRIVSISDQRLPLPLTYNNLVDQQHHYPQFPALLDEDGLTIADRQTKKETDDLLSQALNGLSFEERQEQQEVLHGVDGKVTEEESVVNSALEELDDHLLSIKLGSKYELAESMDPHYVQNKAFRLMFLRGNEYDPKAAASQMLRFFESKHQLFGAQKLVQEITIKDLDEDDIACLKAGWVQNAGRDRSGRQVFIKFAGLFRVPKWSKTLLNDLRVQYFVVMNALMQSEETQIRGTVSIWYGIGDSKTTSNGTRNELLQIFKAARALPQKKAATHICVDEMRQYVMCNVMIQLMKKSMRARLRLHFGSLTECQYKLSTYGIVPGFLPVHTTNGSVNPTRHLQWIESCIIAASCGSMDHPSLGGSGSPNGTCRYSSSLDNNYTTTTPHSNDVLFTGGKNSHHFGNQLFRTLVFDCVPLYYASETARKKAQLVQTIIDKIHDLGGRFLKPIKHGSSGDAILWEPVPMEELKTKIMQTFRNRRRRLDVISKKKNAEGKENVDSKVITGEPLATDVVFGSRGRRRRSSSSNGTAPLCGNDLLQSLLKKHSQEYESLTRGRKMKLVESIMQQIQNQGGRFVSRQNDGKWLQVSESNVKERISKYFRNNRRPSRKVR